VKVITAALFGAARWSSRAARVFNHLAAGTLRIPELRAGVARTWEAVSASDAAVAAGLMPWEEEIVQRFLAPGDRVLLVGSGPGRDLVALAGKGFGVTAVEPARRANETAARHLAARGLAADIIEGFFEDVALPGRFDAVIFSYCCYSFIPGSRRRIAVLRKAASHLADGGRIVISYLTERSGHPILMQLARAAAVITRSDWRPERGDILHPVDTTAPLYHYEHAFQREEIEAEAREAGLAVGQHVAVPVNPVVVLVPGARR
jgi:SAM-dependent methyltransferase